MIQANDVSEGSTAKPLVFREKPLKIDDSMFYFTLHSFLYNYMYLNPYKSLQEKTLELEILADRLGRNINERISMDFLEKTIKEKEKNDIKNLEFIKFLCKDIWIFVFGKAIDRLQTNHKGSFFLTDANFKLLSKFDQKKEETKKYANFVMKFVKGLIKGILSSFQLESEISVDNNIDNEYSFVIKIKD